MSAATAVEGPASFDPTAPLTPSGNLRRRRIVSRLAEYGATAAAALAVGVLGVVLFTIVARGGEAITWEFLTTGSPTGIAPAIVGTGVIVGLAALIATPLGVLVALFLTEFAGARSAGVIKMILDLLNGLPSIIIGLFVFGLIVDPQNKQSAFAGSVGLAIIMLPLIARGSQGVLLLVPRNLREASQALGVSRWRTVIGVTLPSALGGIVTATVLAVARAAGETAPLLLAVSVYDNSNVHFSPGESLANIPVEIFIISEEANPEGFTKAWGAGLVLVAFILFASLGARALLARNRKKLNG